VIEVARPTRVFFASDLHGSTVGWKKFVAAAGFYGADVLVYGGDLMGKQLVPIVLEAGEYRARFNGEDHRFAQDGVDGFTSWLDRSGAYWKVMRPDEYGEANASSAVQDGLFRDAARARLAEWLGLAEERAGVPVFVTGGNDDDPEVLEVLERHEGERVVACEGRVVELDAEHTMATMGWTSPTPWDTWREASEERLAEMIEAAVTNVPDVGRCAFNFHAPPKGTPLDMCLQVEVDEQGLAQPVRSGGRFHWTSGGSVAVREAVAHYQPVVGLHGHIHESPGRFRVGRTQCFNAGSEYGQGHLQGCLFTLKAGSLKGYQHTSG
jgi:Icc-related predicted phosphoesterase